MKEITEEQILKSAQKIANKIVAASPLEKLIYQQLAYDGAKWAISQMQPEWIPVSERLPEIDNPVLVVDQWGYMNVCAYNEKWYPKIDGQHPNFMSESITHWMVLPATPNKF